MRQTKDSGIEWIGEIPEDWNASKIKFHSISKSNKNDKSALKTIALENIESFTSQYVETQNEYDFSEANVANKGDVLFGKLRPYLGKVYLCDEKVCAGPGLAIFQPLDCDGSFLKYSFLNPTFVDYVNSFCHGTKMPAIDTDVLRNAMIPFPSYSEQVILGNFLDNKSSEIRLLIKNLTNQIDKLKEYKKALITKCVTKGLDPNVSLKDSGIDWIGKIPENWKISKIKNMYEVVLGKMLCDKPLDDTYTFENYICSQNIKYAGVNQTSIKKMWFNSKEKEQLFLCDGDVLISEGGNAGECCIYHNEFCPCYIQNAVHRVRGINDNLNKFLYYWLYALETLGYFQMICNKATIRHYTREKVLETPIVCLTINGQKDIVNYLDKKCSEIDALISSKQQQIDKLNEYQKSLIYEYVTGKKEVV